MPTVILLAAGQGLRMGGPNKLLLPFRGSTVLETTLKQLCSAEIGPVYVITGHQRTMLSPILERFPVQEVFNPGYRSGMTSSIQAGVQAADAGKGYMIGLADMPMISTSAYKLLANSFLQFSTANERAILLPRFSGSKGNPVIFSAAYRDDILQHTEPEGCRAIVQANNANIHWLDMSDDGVLRDLDTPDDYLPV